MEKAFNLEEPWQFLVRPRQINASEAAVQSNSFAAPHCAVSPQ